MFLNSILSDASSWLYSGGYNTTRAALCLSQDITGRESHMMACGLLPAFVMLISSPGQSIVGILYCLITAFPCTAKSAIYREIL